MSVNTDTLRGMCYVLDSDGNPVVEPDPVTWSRWYESNYDLRTLGRDHVYGPKFNRLYTVSTVFLGLDHDFGGQGQPVLWETMIFGQWEGKDQWRYTSREDALKGHAAAVDMARRHIRRHYSLWSRFKRWIVRLFHVE